MNRPPEQPNGSETPLASTPLGEDVPAAIPDHQLLHRIGGGSYGEVWLARNALGAYRAAKIIHRKNFEDSRPFEREFNGLLKFEPISRSHEGLVDILQVGRQADYFYYVMELADAAQSQASIQCSVISDQSSASEARAPSGTSLNTDSLITEYSPKTLRSLLRANPQPSTLNPQPGRGRLPADQCVQIGLALTSGLAHLHKHGLVHRDIKPSNIIFVQGAPKLADIGLVTEADTTLSYVGTEGYIPPEGPGAAQADIFSLGKVLYEMATGQDRRQFPDLPPNLKDWPDQAGVLELNEVLVKACARDTRCRYQSCEEMQADLALLKRGQSVRRKRALHHWLAVCKKAGLALSVLAAVVAAAVVVLRQSPRDPYLHSAIPEVNSLVTQGFTCVKTPGRAGRARDFFNAAIKLDPAFVPAYWGLCQTAIHEGGMERNAEAERRLRAVAAKLMEIAPARADSRVASSCVKWVDWDFPGALADAQLATRMPATCQEALADAHGLHGYLLLQSGQPEPALVEYKMAERLDPAMSRIHFHLGHPYFAQRKFDEALKHYQKAIDFQPQSSFAHHLIGRVSEEKGVVAAAKGLGDEAKGHFIAAIQEFEESEKMSDKYAAERKAFYDELREAVRLGGAEGYWRKRLDIALGKSQPNLYYIATLYARLGNKDSAYVWLRKACDQKSFDQGLMFDLCWDHGDPEFRAIARGIGLLQ